MNPGVGESPIFVGRSSEFARLATALDDALGNRGRLVMLAGEPGIGKTRITQQLASLAEARGAAVLWGWSYEEEGAPPYWPWMQMVREYIQGKEPDKLSSDFGPGASDVAEMVPELGQALPDLEPSPPLEPEQARFRLFESMTTFLKNASRDQPFMLVLDDLHWADRPSLLLLQFLARVMADSRLLVVGAYRNVELSREHPLSETIAQVSRQPFCLFELLSGLSQEETESFIEASTGFTPAQDQVETIYSHTEGNPFFLSQVLTLLANRGALTPDTMEIPQRIEMPPGVRGIIGQRLNGLSEQTVGLLTLAAILGREFEFRQLGILDASLTSDKLLAAIDEGLDARLIEGLPVGRDRYRFAHSLIQQVLIEELSASRRMRLHIRAAEGLETLYGPDVEAHASELAYHFAEGDPALATGKLAYYSLLAGERALATNAYEEALRLFVRGLAAKEGQSMDAESSALLFGLGKAQAATHQRREAVTSLTRAFDYYAESGDLERALAVAEYPITPGLGRLRLTPLVSRALQLLPPDAPEAGRLLARHGWCLSSETGDYHGARQSLDQAMAIAQQTGDLALELQTLGTAAQLDLYTLKLEDCAAKSLRAVEVARMVGDLQAEAMAHVSSWAAVGGLGQFDRCVHHGSAALGLAERLRDRTLLVTALWQNSILSMDGNWRSSRLYSDRGLELAGSDARLLGGRALLEHVAGYADEGEAYLDRLVEAMDSSAPGPTFEYLIPSTIIPLVSRITGSLDRLDTAQRAAEVVLASSFSGPFISMWANVGLGLVAIQRGDKVLARKQLAALRPRKGMFLPQISVDHVLGMLASAMGLYDEAVVYFSPLEFEPGHRLEVMQAWVYYDYADTLFHRNGAGDRAKARALLEGAFVLADEMEMLSLKNLISARLDQSRSKRPKLPRYPDGLTTREVEVMRLIAAGKSNREIAEELVISQNTVLRHVSNLFAKTGSTNRAAVATYASQRALV